MHGRRNLQCVTGMPRIGIIAPTLEILGGQGIQANALIARLRNDGYDVSLIPINPQFPAGLGWVRRYPYLRTLLNQALFLPSLMKLRRIDVAHIFSASYWSFVLAPLPAILAARSLGKRVILNYRSGEADDHLAHWGKLIHPWLRLVDEIVVPSHYLHEVFKRHGYHARVIRNVVDLSRFQYRQRKPLRPHLLSNRNFEPHYMVDCTLQAFTLVKARYPEATLMVAGYGSEERRLRELAASFKTDGIKFVGRIEPESMPSLYGKADIYVNCSVIDNQPVSLLEAFASGIPVVSTGVGDIPFMMRHGETGSIVPQRDPEAMAKAIMLLLENPDHALSTALRARQEVEMFTWPRVRQEWAMVYSGSKA